MDLNVPYVLLVVLLVAIPIFGLLYIRNNSAQKTRLPTAEEMRWIALKAVIAVKSAQSIYGDAKLTNREKFSHAVDLLRDAITAEGMVVDPALRDAVINIVYDVLKPSLKTEINPRS